MGVYHILKDGSTPKDITGYIVKKEYAESLYRYIGNKASRKKKEGTKK